MKTGNLKKTCIVCDLRQKVNLTDCDSSFREILGGKLKFRLSSKFQLFDSIKNFKRMLKGSANKLH